VRGRIARDVAGEAHPPHRSAEQRQQRGEPVGAASCGSPNPAASSRRRTAWPIPSSSHKLCAVSSTPSSSTWSISISGSCGRPPSAAGPASSTRLMLVTSRRSTQRSSASARPKLCTTRAPARLA
jgi:hypothetical protein